MRRHTRIRPTAAVLAFLVFASSAFAGPVVISEIMFNPDGDENAREFVEIANLSTEPCSLQGCEIGDTGASEAIVPAQDGGWMVPAGGFALILDPDYFTTGEPYPSIPPGTPLFTVPGSTLGSRGLSNSSSEPVALISSGGDTLSVVRYSAACPAGHSWERILPEGTGDSTNFAVSLATDGTPGFRNSVTPPDHNPALAASSLAPASTTLRMGGTADVLVSCRNAGLETISDIRVRVWLEPDTPAGVVEFPDDILPGADAPAVRLTLPALPGGISTLAAAIGNETAHTADDTLRLEIAVPVPAGTVSLNEFMAAPATGAEWIELFNTGAFPVALRGWTVSDSQSGQSGGISGSSSIPAGGFALVTGGSIALSSAANPCVVTGFPALNNDGDTIRLHDHTGAACDSTAYGETESGVSTELIAPALRGTSSGWDFCTGPSGGTPGAQNSIFFRRADGASASGGTSLMISPNPFSGTTTISYDLPFPLARVRIAVYDRRGRFIASVRETAESGSSWSGTWDGRAGGRRLPAGPYILLFEVMNKTTGKMTVIRKPIVVGANL